MHSLIRTTSALLLAFKIGQARADQIQMYTFGHKSLAAHLEAMSSAKESIDIVSYEFKPCDASTKAIIGVLGHKAKKGIRVRVMLDNFSLSQSERKGLPAYFSSLGIQLKTYNRSFLLGNNHRSHIKLTLIDGESKTPTYFVDSSNFTDQYFGMAKGINYVNRDFKITGSSGRQAFDAFEMLWTSRPAGKVRTGKRSEAVAFANSCLVSNKRDARVTSSLNAKVNEWSSDASVYSCANVKYVADNPRFQDQGLSESNRDDGRPHEEYMNDLRLKRKLATASFLNFINGAKRVLNVENQYYIPIYRVRRLFDDLREERGVSIMILTNLTALGIDETSSRQLSYHIAKSARRDSDGEMGVFTLPSRGRLEKPNPLTIDDGSGSWHLHSKSMVRDHKDVWMGSFNIDPRSYSTNLENAATVTGCPALAAAIERDYQNMLENYYKDMASCKSCKGEAVNLNPFEAIGAFFKQNFL